MKLSKAMLVASLTAFAIAAPACDDKKADTKKDEKADKKDKDKKDDKAEKK